MRIKRLGTLLAALLLALSARGASELIEFSTSMDFAEFDVVLKHLKRSDAYFSQELQRHLADFQAEESVGGARRRELAKGQGYVVLEREDEQAFTIYVFTTAQRQADLQAAYDRATAELGI